MSSIGMVALSTVCACACDTSKEERLEYTFRIVSGNMVRSPPPNTAYKLAATDPTTIAEKIKPLLAKYETKCINEHLDELVVAQTGTLYSEGKRAGGLILEEQPRVIYMEEASLAGKDTSIHHELNSVLLRQHFLEFPWLGWLTEVPGGFEYRNRLSQPSAPEISDDKLLESGFVCRYGTESIEEDINTIAHMAFSRNTAELNEVRKAERVKGKIDLLYAFYRNIGAIK